MSDNRNISQSPLSFDDIQQIEATNLGNIERHHLRLMAHCLGCFREMVNGSSSGPLPDENLRLKWCLDQPSLAKEKAFVSVLLEQFAAAAEQLEKIASIYEMTPLELTLEDLIRYSLNSQIH